MNFKSFTVNRAPYVCLVFMIRDSYSVCKRRIQWTFLNRLRSNYSCKTAIILLLLMTCYMVIAIVKTVQHTSTIVSNDKFTTAVNPCFLKSFSKEEVRYFWVTLGTLIHFIRYRLQIKFQFSQRKCNMFYLNVHVQYVLQLKNSKPVHFIKALILSKPPLFILMPAVRKESH